MMQAVNNCMCRCPIVLASLSVDCGCASQVKAVLKDRVWIIDEDGSACHITRSDWSAPALGCRLPGVQL